MRKDEIEERIVQIEKTLRKLQSGQRQSSDAVIAELRAFQGLIIEERIESMRQQMARGHQHLLLDLVIPTVRRELETVCPNPCSLFNRSECIDFFLCRLKDSAERVDPDEVEGFLVAQVQQDSALLVRYPELDRTPCRSCFDTYCEERDGLMRAIGKLSTTRHVLRQKKQDLYIADLPVDQVIPTIIEPLSSPIRFAMLKGLSGGSMSYSELSTLTGYKGGHLLFHVTRLIEAGLILKSEPTGLYGLTEKGMAVMTMIKNLYCS
ncbi:MAG: winged helix-turn-helix domain-containing protein [Methanoregula sp.]|nr:winged helix-turn-helix domain-containing protein [Methanoregula sp.]